MTNERLSDYVHAHADAAPSRIAFITRDGDALSYGQFEHDSVCMAGFLMQHDVQVGDRIAYACEGTYGFFCLSMAAAMTGALLVGLPTGATVSETSTIVEETSPRFAFCAEKLQDGLRSALDSAGCHDCLLIVEGKPHDSHSLPFCEASTSDAAALRRARSREDLVGSDTPLMLISTSGSSGRPKGVVLTHRNVIASALEQARHFGGPDGCSPDDVFQHQVPVNHVSGAIEWGATPLVIGCTSILAQTFDPRRILENTQRHHATILAGVPTMWNLMFKLPDFERFDLGSVRYCMTGAAPASKDQLARMLKISPFCDNPLGLTETSGFCTYVDCGHTSPDAMLDTVGHVAENLDYRIADEQGHPVEVGEVGELAYRGDAVFKGYYRQPMETAKAIDADGFFHSGDLALEDASGNIHLRGRNDDRYCCGAYNVYPIEAEAALATFPGVDKVAVVAIPHETLGSVGRAYIVPTPGTTLSSAALKHHLKARLSAYKIPQEYVIVDSLPLTSLGKPAKGELRMQVAEEFATHSPAHADFSAHATTPAYATSRKDAVPPCQSR